MELTEFVLGHLPPPPARVLEVGCGRGELALELSRHGYGIIAIDPEAPAGGIFRRISLEQLADPGPFDAVVASRSLHHIPALAAALDKVVRLLRPSGRLLVNEHAWDRLDEPTARWYLGRRAKLPDPPDSLDECLLEWQEDHAGLHGYEAMRRELDRRFAELFFAWVPYLYREFDDPRAEAEEAALIDAGKIRATGFRYVGAVADR